MKVHEYDDIDPERVYGGLQAAVREVPEYLRLVGERVKKAAPKQAPGEPWVGEGAGGPAGRCASAP